MYLDDNFDSNDLSLAASTNSNDNGETTGGFPDTDIVGGESNWRGATAGGAAAPIELQSFTVLVRSDGSVKIKWKTLSESNNDYFTVERSKDAQTWEELAYVKGAGDSDKVQSYVEIDLQPFWGTSYYRLKQTDFDGAFSYSSIMDINMDPGKVIPLTIFPNPSKGPLTLEGAPGEINSFTFFDVAGKNVTTQVWILYQGELQVQFDISKLPRGVYLLKTKNETLKVVKK